MLQGTLPVLATPFDVTGSIDQESLARLVHYALDAGADGVVYPGVASEFSLLTAEERVSAFERIAKEVNARVPIIVGASATTSEISGNLAREGADRGASAAMVMAPVSVGREAGPLIAFFKDVAERGGIPIMLQNVYQPIGSGLDVKTMLEVAEAVPQVRYVKEETLPAGQRITQMVADKPSTIESVFGGAGGRFIIDELTRGVAGTLPASELTETHVKIVRTYRSGDVDEARRIFNRILPLLNMNSVFRMRTTKAILKARGIFATEIVRDDSPKLDTQDRNELRIMLDDVADLLTVCPPSF